MGAGAPSWCARFLCELLNGVNGMHFVVCKFANTDILFVNLQT